MINEEFINLSPAEKRIFIAKDVITHLKSRKLYASTLGYFKNSRLFSEVFDGGQNVDLQAFLNDNQENCSVCAKGALFVADVIICDNFIVTNENYNSSKAIEEKLEYFSKEQLDLIEIAFEGCKPFGSNNMFVTYDINNNITKSYSNIIRWRQNLKNPYSHAIMIAIMENIIENNGDFVV